MIAARNPNILMINYFEYVDELVSAMETILETIWNQWDTGLLNCGSLLLIYRKVSRYLFKLFKFFLTLC